jgi:hypothetical protein
MGNSSALCVLIHESICYHSQTDLGAQQARVNRFSYAARAILIGTAPEQLSEVFVATKRVA